MDSQAVAPNNLEEHLVWYAITGTWLFYVLGALYIVGPALAWILLTFLGLKAFAQTDLTEPAERIRMPLGVWLWVIGMGVMEIALVMGHLDFHLGLPQTIKSSIGWAKGWALLAIFILLGAGLRIRLRVVARAICRLSLQTLCLLPLFLAAGLLHLPDTLYVSPLKLLGGPGPEFFEVQLYGLNPESGLPRWRFFTPWAPAAGMIANVHLILALRDRSSRWRLIGIIAAVAMCLMSQSRLALIAMPVVAIATLGLANLTRPLPLIAAAIGTTTAGLLANWLLVTIEDLIARFKGARAGSSRVRATLGRIALQRWQSEAPIWGHGVVEQGPHLVEYMPIGSHHSWYGLLFVKGLVGLVALAIPIAYSLCEMLAKAQASRTARVGLSIIMILVLYSFGENLEILSYLFWPGLLAVGMASRQRLRSPFGKRLGA